MSETWGELIAEAEFHMRQARTALVEPLRDVDTARYLALAHNDVLRGLRANLCILDPSSHPPYADILDAEFTQLGRLVTSLTPTTRRDMSVTAATPWHDAAHKLHCAADILGSHLGPDRAHRTPDAAVLDDPAELRAAITTVAALAEITADASCHLALRVHETALHHDGTVIDTWARGALGAAVAIKHAASDLLAQPRPESQPARLTDLRAAPLLRPTITGDPLMAARQSFDQVRLIAHRQARSEIPAGVDTLRTLAHVGAMTSTYAYAIFSAASAKELLSENEQLARISWSLLEARPAWARINAAIAGCASVTRSPQLLIREAETLNTSLATLTFTPGGCWLTPERMLGNRHHSAALVALATHIANRLPDLSRSTTAIADQLDRSGVLLMPTRERDDIDHPYRWAPLGAERRDDIRSAISQTSRVCNGSAITMSDAPMTESTATAARAQMRFRDARQRNTTTPPPGCPNPLRSRSVQRFQY